MGVESKLISSTVPPTTAPTKRTVDESKGERGRERETWVREREDGREQQGREGESKKGEREGA